MFMFMFMAWHADPCRNDCISFSLCVLFLFLLIKFRLFVFFRCVVMPAPLELDAELTAELSNALFEFRPTAGGATLLVVSLPATGNGVLICELTPFQLAAALAARRIAAAPKAKAAAKGKGKGRSRSPRRYLEGCKCFGFYFFHL